eukprot:1215_1
MCIQQVDDNYDHVPKSSLNPSLLSQQTNALQSVQNKKQQRALHSPLNNQNHLTNMNLKYQQLDLTRNYKVKPTFSYQQIESYFFDDIYDNTPKLPPPSNDKKQQRPKLIKYPIKFKISQQVVLPRNYETKSELSYQHTEFKHHVTDKAFYDNLS